MPETFEEPDRQGTFHAHLKGSGLDGEIVRGCRDERRCGGGRIQPNPKPTDAQTYDDAPVIANSAPESLPRTQWLWQSSGRKRTANSVPDINGKNSVNLSDRDDSFGVAGSIAGEEPARHADFLTNPAPAFAGMISLGRETCGAGATRPACGGKQPCR